MARIKATTIAGYISGKPKETHLHLRELHSILLAVAPKAKQTIKWGNPCYEEERILFAFAAFKAHVNFYPTSSSLAPFEKELEKYKTGKGSLQLPYDQPIPKTLIKKIAAHRLKDVRENDSKWM